MSYKNLLTSQRGGIARITVNSPGKANSLDRETVAELKLAFESLGHLPETRVVVLTGAGERAFIGGADINVLESLTPSSAEPFIRSLHEMMHAVRSMPVPALAEVNGHALGAGLELMMACDIAIAAEHAMLGMPEVKLGMPSVIEAALMTPILGLMRTRELLLTGDNISAQEAWRIGLVNQVVKSEELPGAVGAMCRRLMSNPAGGVRVQKQLINRWLNLPMDEAIEAGVRSFMSAYSTGEPGAAIADFKAKRLIRMKSG